MWLLMRRLSDRLGSDQGVGSHLPLFQGIIVCENKRKKSERKQKMQGEKKEVRANDERYTCWRVRMSANDVDGHNYKLA